MRTFYISVILYLAIAGVLVHVLFDIANLHTFNNIYRYTPQQQFDQRISILTLDDESSRKLQSGSVPTRIQFAQAIDNLSEIGARLVVMDVVFNGNKPEDPILEKSMKSAGNVIISAYEADVMEGNTKVHHTSEILSDKESGIGRTESKLSFIPDYFLKSCDVGLININQQFVVRGLSPYLKIGDELFPRLYLRTLERFYDCKAAITEEGGRKYLNLGERKIMLSGTATGNDLYTNEMLINYQGIEYNFQYNYMPFSYLISDNWKSYADSFRDKIVFIIPATLLSQDIMSSPDLSGLRQRSMFRGMLHINMVNQVLQDKLLTDYRPEYIQLLIFALFCLFSFIFYKISLVKGFILLVLGIVSYTTASYSAFSSYRIVGLNFVLMDFMMIGAYFSISGFKYLNERKIRGIFKRYVGSKVLNEVIKFKDSTKLFEGRMCDLTVLLIDIRGFTNLSETLKPEETVRILNEFFNLITRIILDYGGTVDKFMGDAVLAFFGAPIEILHKEKKAVKCCMDIIEKIENATFHGVRLKIGMSVTTGEIVVGNIGSVEKMEYTIIGPAVNLAARLEALNKKYQTGILLDKTTIERAEMQDFAKIIGEETIRGFSEKKIIYTLKEKES